MNLFLTSVLIESPGNMFLELKLFILKYFVHFIHIMCSHIANAPKLMYLSANVFEGISSTFKSL